MLQNRNKKGKIETFLLNPKSVSIDELFGKSDQNTLEWTDGLFGNAIRSFINSLNLADNEVSIFIN